MKLEMFFGKIIIGVYLSDVNKWHRYHGFAYCSNCKERTNKQWFLHNKTHRLDGPAVIFHNKDLPVKKYFINGKCLK